MKRIILFAAALEVTYLALSFLLAQFYGQWSYEGELVRTGLRLIPIVFYGYCYQKYCYNENQKFNIQTLFAPQFVVAIVLLLLFAAAYTNADNEPVLWQLVFVISGIAAGLREELFYRGLVQSALQKKYNQNVALALASLLFTLSHVQYLYYGQFSGLLLICFAGIIFGSVFIYSGSIVFTASIHGLYDAVLSINLLPHRLGNELETPLLFLIVLIFLIIKNKKVFSYQSMKTGGGNPDNLSMG